MHSFVLVLNANYEPLNICNLRRAIGLMISAKATLVLNGRGEIHTSSRSFPAPSVIRLQNMVHKPRIRLKMTRREVFRRDNYTCQYCGKTATTLTIDHIIPRHMGGSHIWTNVVTACSTCNHRKGGRLLKDANMVLLHPVHEPPTNADYIFGHYLKEYNEWASYLQGW